MEFLIAAPRWIQDAAIRRLGQPEPRNPNPDRPVATARLSSAGRSNRTGPLSHLPFFFSHDRIKAISASCAFTISSASLRISGSLPKVMTIFAMSIAP